MSLFWVKMEGFCDFSLTIIITFLSLVHKTLLTEVIMELVKGNIRSHSVSNVYRDPKKYEAKSILHVIRDLRISARAQSDKTNILPEYGVYDGHEFKLWSLRYTTFLNYPLKCCTCGLEMTHAYFEKQHIDNKRFHLNFYGTNSDGSQEPMS